MWMRTITPNVYRESLISLIDLLIQIFLWRNKGLCTNHRYNIMFFTTVEGKRVSKRQPGHNQK